MKCHLNYKMSGWVSFQLPSGQWCSEERLTECDKNAFTESVHKGGKGGTDYVNIILTPPWEVRGLRCCFHCLRCCCRCLCCRSHPDRYVVRRLSEATGRSGVLVPKYPFTLSLGHLSSKRSSPIPTWSVCTRNYTP